jgi:uncharacterized protein YukE
VSWLSSLVNSAKQDLGTVVDDGANVVGDGLNAVGLHGAAQDVETLGDKAGFDLGASVPELELGQTSDPTQLIHGDPAAIRSSASTLKTFSSAFGETAIGLNGLEPSEWTGSAADAFRAKYAPHPAKWRDASSATGTASAALESYAGAVESAQARAGQAIEEYNQGQQTTSTATADYNAQVAAYNSAAQTYDARLAAGQAPGTPPTEPGPFTDPGESLRAQAQQILNEARSARDAASASASAAISGATGLAPPEPSFWAQVGDDLSDAFQVENLGALQMVGGVVEGAADIAGPLARPDGSLERGASRRVPSRGVRHRRRDCRRCDEPRSRGEVDARHRLGQRPVRRRRPAHSPGRAGRRHRWRGHRRRRG